MKTLKRKSAFKLWEQWWNELENDYFKIEVLQDYSGEDDGMSLKAWIAGDKRKSIECMVNHMEEWIDMCQSTAAAIGRIRIIEEPKTQYTEWEIELYRRVNIPLAKENVYLVESERVKHLNIPDGDVTIFDEKRIARAYYTPGGKVEKMDFYEEPEDDISDWLQLRGDVMKEGVPIKFELDP